MKKAANLFCCIAIPICAYSNSTNPDSSTYYLSQANLLIIAGKDYEAELSFKKAIEFSVGNINHRLDYINHLINKRKFFVALEQLQKVFLVKGNEPRALLKTIEISYLLHRWKDVMKYGTQISPEIHTAKTYYFLGKAYYEEEDYGLAEKALLESLKLRPQDLDALILLGKVNIEVSNYKMALFYYNQGIVMDPDNNTLLYELGLLEYTLNHEKEAIKYMELAALKGYPVNLDYKENLGMAYLALDVNKGVEILNEVLSKKPNDNEILFQIAQAHLKAKNFQIAADTYYKIYLNDNENTKALYMTGIAYQKKGDRLLGKSYCEQAIKLNPELGGLKQLKISMN